MQYIYTLLGAISSGDTAIAVGKGALVVAGHAPSVSAGYAGTPAKGAVVLAGHAPTILTHADSFATPGLGRLAIKSYTPTITGHPFTPPVLGAGDDSVPLRWRKRDERLRPIFSPVLRRKETDAPGDAAVIEAEPDADEGGLYKDAEQRAAILEALDAHIDAIRRENAARGLARMAREAGRRQAAIKVRAATEQARAHAERAIKIAQRLAAGRLVDEDE